MQKKNYNRSKPEILRFLSPVEYRRFQNGCVFVEYDLFNDTIFIQNCIYIHFRINLSLTEFYIKFLRQEHQIDVS